MPRVYGHGLVGEGAPHDEQRHRVGRWSVTAGEGRGLCQCGALSSVLLSANQRKAWHRQHKAEQA